MTAEPQLIWYAPKRRLILFVGLGIAMTFLAFACMFIGTPASFLVGAFGTAFFGACTVVILRRAFNRDPVLTVTDDGIDLWQHPFIPWSEVTGIGAVPASGEMFLVIDVVDREAYFARMSARSRRWVKISAEMLPGAAFLSARMLPEPVDSVVAKIAEADPLTQS